MSSKQNLGEDIYDGAATFGRIRATISVVFGTIFGILSLGIGVFLLFKKTKYKSSVLGTIINDTNCNKVANISSSKKQEITYNYICKSLEINYEVDGTMEKLVTDTNSPVNYKKGDNLKIFYDPINPKISSITSDNYHLIGAICVGVGSLMLIGTWFWYKMTMKYKFIAAAGGISGAAGMISDAIN